MDLTDIPQIVGMTFEEAENFLKPLDMVIRAVYEAGDYVLVSQDYRLDRVNVSIRDSKIVGWSIG